MGPRQRRRLITVGVCLAVVAVVGALSIWAASGNRSGSSRGGSEHTPPGGQIYVFPNKKEGTFILIGATITKNLSYGMTPRQVRHRIGEPEKTLRDQDGSTCWQYPENLKAVTPKDAAIVAVHTFNATRVCFEGGRYALYHYEVDGRWDYAGQR